MSNFCVIKIRLICKKNSGYPTGATANCSIFK
nr:MAG TPA: hypothetical protein [Caudoviricetes sp.]